MSFEDYSSLLTAKNDDTFTPNCSLSKILAVHLYAGEMEKFQHVIGLVCHLSWICFKFWGHKCCFSLPHFRLSYNYMSANIEVELLDYYYYSQANYCACYYLFVTIKCVFSARPALLKNLGGLVKMPLMHVCLYRKVDYEKQAHFLLKCAILRAHFRLCYQGNDLQNWLEMGLMS